MAGARTLKVALIGDAGVGKSAIAKQFLSKTFSKAKHQTIMFEFGHKHVCFHDTIGDDAEPRKLLFQVWDCGSGQLAQQVFLSYLGFCHAIFVVYDVTRVESFLAVPRLLQEAKAENDRAVLLVVGNKDDQRDEAQVSSADADAVARKYGAHFVPCTASRYTSVEALFRLAAEHAPETPVYETRTPPAEAYTLEEVVKSATKSSGQCCAIV